MQYTTRLGLVLAGWVSGTGKIEHGHRKAADLHLPLFAPLLSQIGGKFLQEGVCLRLMAGNVYPRRGRRRPVREPVE